MPLRFLLLIRHDDSFIPPSDLGPETEAWMNEMDGRGVRRSGHRLTPYAQGHIVQQRGGQTTVASRPTAKGFEVAGYDLIEVTDPEQAIEIAAAHPMARWGQVELRELWQPSHVNDATPIAAPQTAGGGS